MSSPAVPRTEIAPTSIVERLVSFACLAPSVHNTQPWRWRYDAGLLTLRADLDRRLPAEDPRGRNLTISCGAALHHLQLASRALGWETDVRRLPPGADETVLADVRVHRDAPAPVVPSDLALLRTRCTDRRRFTDWPVPRYRLEDLCREAAPWGVRAAAIVDDGARFRLELLANQALTDLELDAARQAEQDRWIGRTGADGIPASLLPGDPDPLRARSRFRPGLLEDTRMVLHGGERVIALGGSYDDVAGWLRTGEALSALWLEATRAGLSVVPMSQPIEVETTRREIGRSVLGGAFEPHVLLRVGWQAIGRSGLPRTPRRPLADVLEV
ncbi:NAD(P)H nitroreductase [Pimelobacter simplex]|uniref:NAD(P)H nitroreductase n=1 Tax=Nocardioides simplex TaxID=2045 RepID=A0A7J5DYR7_NOCSI|nr:NAD(P)H nitroreductase [Pimelobacter simplex]KAB2810814.1 NAD(P)H nitroreductase [Pimelobacter simplex]